MFSRPMLLAGVLAASAVVPYVALDEQLAATARGQWQRLTGIVRPGSDGHDEEQPLDIAQISSATAQGLGVAIEEAFRFDISPQWIARRWPRASMVHGGPEQLGMRVAWVSGTRPDDVAGSLTYYFDPHHQLQRITFTGLAAEPRRLLGAVIPAHGLRSLPTTEAAHYVAGDLERPTSEVLVTHLPVMSGEPGAARFEVSIELGRGDALSPAASAERDAEGRPLPSHYRRW